MCLLAVSDLLDEETGVLHAPNTAPPADLELGVETRAVTREERL